VLRLRHSGKVRFSSALPRSNQIDATLFQEGRAGNKGLVMKKLLLSTAAIIVLAAPATAADLPARPRATKAPAYTAPAAVYNWTGFYIGGQIGGAFSGNNSLQGSGGRFLGGVEGGVDYQFAPNWVIGAEAQYNWLAGNNKGVMLPGNNLVQMNDNQLGSVTGRVGYTWGPGLLYAKGGYAWKDGNNIRVSMGGVPEAFTVTGNHRDGYTVGGGLEYMFAPSWSAKVEYQYYDFGSTTFTTGPAGVVGARFRDDDHTVKAGVNYRFGWGGPEMFKY
jgi:outer membrane immunogenic protein